MSEQNLEISRRIDELWNAGEMEASVTFSTTTSSCGTRRAWPEPGPSVGRDAVMRQFELLRQDWRTDRLDTLDRRAADDCVVVQQRWRAEGGHSGAISEMMLSSVARFRDGKLAEVAFYWDHAEALAAAGL